MRYSQSYFTNELERLRLNADEIKQAQLTSQNSGMLGFMADENIQYYDIPAMGQYEIIVLHINCTLYEGEVGQYNQIRKPIICYPYIDFANVGDLNNRSTFNVTHGGLMQTLDLKNSSGSVVGDVTMNYMIGGLVQNSQSSWSASISVHSDQATRLAIIGGVRSTVRGWISMTVEE